MINVFLDIDDYEEKASYEEMKKEALKRIAKIGLDNEIYSSFKENDKIICSDNGKMTEVPEHIMEGIKKWQDKYGNIVYHVIHSKLFYETYECLSVSCYLSDWDYERNLLCTNWIMSHSINIDKPEYTESGSIKFFRQNGTLSRIG